MPDDELHVDDTDDDQDASPAGAAKTRLCGVCHEPLPEPGRRGGRRRQYHTTPNPAMPDRTCQAIHDEERRRLKAGDVATAVQVFSRDAKHLLETLGPHAAGLTSLLTRLTDVHQAVRHDLAAADERTEAAAERQAAAERRASAAEEDSAQARRDADAAQRRARHAEQRCRDEVGEAEKRVQAAVERAVEAESARGRADQRAERADADVQAARAERDELAGQVAALSGQVQSLQTAVAVAQARQDSLEVEAVRMRGEVDAHAAREAQAVEGQRLAEAAAFEARQAVAAAEATARAAREDAQRMQVELADARKAVADRERLAGQLAAMQELLKRAGAAPGTDEAAPSSRSPGSTERGTKRGS